jgi:uncharacterized protein (TIGR02302 family)
MMKQLDRKILAARAVLLWEAGWRALLPVMSVLGVFVLLALAGLFETLPQNLHYAVLAGFFLALGWFARPLFALRPPSRDDAIRRLEKASGARHRPASAYTDTLGTDDGDANAKTLWAAHRNRMAKLVARLRPDWPKPQLAGLDPFALRALLVLSLVAAFLLAGPDRRTRLAQAVNPAEKTLNASWMEAWVSPPSYTGRAPLFLIGKNRPNRFKPGEIIEIPSGSQVVARLSRAGAPAVEILPFQSKPGKAKADPVKTKTLSDRTKEARFGLKQSKTVILKAHGRPRAIWHFKVLPDQVPKVVLVEPVTSTAHKALQFEIRLSDDYGVISAGAGFQLLREKKSQTREPVTPLPVKAPDFNIPLPKSRAKTLKHKVFRDLTAHPWAGLKVKLEITARDEANQTGRSNPVTFTMPARRFSKPLARAIIEQRRNLVFDTNDRFKVATALDALTLLPETIIKDSSIYLSLRTAYYRLSRAIEADAFYEVVDMLWDIALKVEDGDLSFAERQLRNAQRALMRALAEGASQDEISKLMRQLRQALNRYLRALAQQMRRQPGSQQLPPNAQMLNPLDLNRMLNMLENLARTGSREAAQRLLSQLRNLLENLRAGRMGRGQNQRQSGMSRALNGLSGLIGRQQRLMDRTFRQGRGRNGSGQGQFEGEGLAKNQDELRRMLRRLQRQLKQFGMRPPSALDRAGSAMGGASRSLRGNNRGQAVERQGRALDQLRQGVQSMAREMMRRMTNGRNGRRGRFLSNRRDPLGRPMRTTGPDFGDATKVPNEIEIQRAREIMRELQKRLGDRARPLLELDYIERLLRRF